jgi:hypothetical protein
VRDGAEDTNLILRDGAEDMDLNVRDRSEDMSLSEETEQRAGIYMCWIDQRTDISYQTFHCVGGCWVRTQESCDLVIDS